MGNFMELKVWQRSKNLAIHLYGVTGQGMISKDYGLRDQMRRAAVSISSNIAEGDELESDKQSTKYFHIAKGSSAELLTQVIISYEIGYFSNEEFNYLHEECDAISRMLSNLIKSRKGGKEAALAR